MLEVVPKMLNSGALVPNRNNYAVHAEMEWQPNGASITEVQHSWLSAVGQDTNWVDVTNPTVGGRGISLLRHGSNATRNIIGHRLGQQATNPTPSAASLTKLPIPPAARINVDGEMADSNRLPKIAVDQSRGRQNADGSRLARQNTNFREYAQREREVNSGLNYNYVSISHGQANIVTYPRLKQQLNEQNLYNIASQDTRLAAAIQGVGNFSIGRATRQEADKLGRIWVGDGARQTSGGSWISNDGTRQYRPPSNKSSAFAITGVQANFETFKVDPVTGKRIQIKNGHLNID